MPGLSPDPSRIDRIIELINDGLSESVSELDSFVLMKDKSCWRCERANVVVNQLTLCGECRAYLSCETDVDPSKITPAYKAMWWAPGAYRPAHDLDIPAAPV